MYENEFPSGNGRGRGRGRGRGLWRPSGPNREGEGDRGRWRRGERQPHPSQNAAPNPNHERHQNMPVSQQNNNKPPQQMKKEDWPALSSLAKPPPPPPNLPHNGAPSFPPKTPTVHQVAAQKPPTPPSPLPSSPYSQSGSISQGGSISTTSNSCPPKSLLTSNFSPPPRILLSDRYHPRMENNNRGNLPPFISPEEMRLNFRSQLKNLRSQMAAPRFPQRGGRYPSPQESNRSYNVENYSSPGLRRGNKRPVNSPTNVTNDTSLLPQKNVRQSEPQNKKKKKKRKSEGETIDKDNKNKSLISADLLELEVDENKSFSEQTEELIAKLEQTGKERKMRVEVLKDVADIFSPYLPFVEPQIYGSTLTNIAFKSSDLDIFLYCPKGQPEYNFVLEKGRLMYKSPKFTNIVRVPRARVPVIKATHIETNVDVDISTMSGQAVHNSMLIKHIFSVDCRLRPLAMLISLWSKLNTITGHSRFTSYSVVLMLIYYLQKITPPILPPLKDILYSNEENDWPKFFIQKPLENENTSDIAQLFKGFFKFYNDFNFEQNVISPYLGQEIPKYHFRNVEELTDDFRIYKDKLKNDSSRFMINNVIHVQDPIEHNVNTSKGVFHRLLKLFRRSCERTLHICSDRLQQNHWLPTILKQPPLKLLDEKKYHLIINYPVNSENWFEKCKQDFRELLKILLIRISEEEFENDPESNGGKQRDSFFAEANYNVFNKKFRFPLRMYMSGTIHLNELQKQFEIVMSRIQVPPVHFKTRFTLEGQKEKGCVKVTIIDKNTTGSNSFISIVTEFKRYCGKFLTDMASPNDKTTEDTVVNGTEVVVMDCDANIKQKDNGEEDEVQEEEEEEEEKDVGAQMDSVESKVAKDNAEKNVLTDIA